MWIFCHLWSLSVFHLVTSHNRPDRVRVPRSVRSAGGHRSDISGISARGSASYRKNVSIKGKSALRLNSSAWKAGEPSAFTLANDCVFKTRLQKGCTFLAAPLLTTAGTWVWAVKGKSVESKSYLESTVSPRSDCTFGALKSEMFYLKNQSYSMAIARKKSLERSAPPVNVRKMNL